MSDGLTETCRRVVSATRFAPALLLLVFTFSAGAQTITDLRQLTQALSSEDRVYRDVDLRVTVLAVSRPTVGAVIVRDGSGVELLELENNLRQLVPGERIRVQGSYCLMRRREMGTQITVGPVVDNDGIHIHRTWGGYAALREGLNPIELDWFNGLGGFNLEVRCAISNEPPENIASSNLWHMVVDEAGHTNLLPGLRAECYEGYWEKVPDFNLLRPVKAGTVTNFDLSFRTRNERVGIRFTGYVKVPCGGQYHFRVRSDDGSLLFLGKRELAMARVGFAKVPAATPGFLDETMHSLTERLWTTVIGRVSFISKEGEGFAMQLSSGRNAISVRVADAAGLDPTDLLNARVKVTGVGRGVLTAGQRIVLGELAAASTKEVVSVWKPSERRLSLPVSSVGQVRNLSVEEARRALPVSIRGVVTDAKTSFYNRYLTIQDDTRGIFVSLGSVTNAAPAYGEFWKVDGHTGAGDFAPIIVADKMTFLGEGQLPDPARPTWSELLNGSLDSQWAELKGLITDVHSNQVTLLLPEGRLNVLMDDHYESDLKPFLNSVATIRGVLYADWDAQTREVRVGSVMMRHAVVCVDTPAPANPFDAVMKTPRELRLFDPKATAFRRVKVRGQIVYADATQAFLEKDGVGLRLLPPEKANVYPGDIVEAVGYPEISQTTVLMRQVIMRTLGRAALPVPHEVSESELTRNGFDSTRVRVEGKLLGWHPELGAPVLEMQSGTHLYLAQLAPRWANRFSLRPGSRLALAGVYVSRGRSEHSNGEVESFELLLNSPADIAVLSQPSWWSLQRLLILVGVLLVTLSFTAIWITQLRRLVEQRTRQLRQETRQRERVERQHAIEAERSRIARDLHDDLGSSLTEIDVLASTGQRPRTNDNDSVSLFGAIANKAKGLIAALDVIVWAVDPAENSLQSLADYLSGFADEFLAHTSVDCRLRVPVSFPQITLEGRIRHELFLSVKEALNNIVRHAEATQVEFQMAVIDNALHIVIADNGKGFEPKTEREGYGLESLSRRLKKVGGSCVIDSGVGSGTTVKIHLPLPVPRGATPDVAQGKIR